MKKFTKKFMAVALVGAALAGFSATGAEAHDRGRGHDHGRYDKKVVHVHKHKEVRHVYKHKPYKHAYRHYDSRPKYVYKERHYYSNPNKLIIGFNF